MQYSVFLKKSFTFILELWVTGLLFLLPACQSNSTKQSKTIPSDSLFHATRLSALSDSILKFPDSAKYYFERGALLFTTKDFGQAKKDFHKALSLDPLMSAYATALGQLYLNQKFPDSAAYYFRKAVQIEPANQRARLQLAFVLLKQNKYQAILRQTDTLLKKNNQLTQAMGLQSQAFQALGDTVMALQVMKKVINLPPVSYEALMRMGDLLMSRGDENALVYYKKAAKKDAAAGEPYYCMGLFYQEQGQIQKAIDSYNQSIVKDVNFVLAYRHVGRLYEKIENWEKAKEIFNLAVQISPTDAVAYFHRGLANEKLNHLPAAVADYKQALVFDAHLEKAKAALKRIKTDNQ